MNEMQYARGRSVIASVIAKIKEAVAMYVMSIEVFDQSLEYSLGLEDAYHSVWRFMCLNVLEYEYKQNCLVLVLCFCV